MGTDLSTRRVLVPLDEYGLTHADLEPLYADYLSAFDVELEHA